MIGGSPREADYHMSWAQVRVIIAQSCIRKGDADITNLRMEEKREGVSDPTPGCSDSFTQTGLLGGLPISSLPGQVQPGFSCRIHSQCYSKALSSAVHVPPGT